MEAPKLTKEMADATVKDVQYHHFPGTLHTVCLLKLRNGYTVTGESACVSPENFSPVVGEQLAYEDAKEKIWVLEGYLLKEMLAGS